MTSLPRMEVARWECQRHSAALHQALADWQALPSRPWQAVEADVTAVRLLDQILYRFSKLQDAAGERLIPATLALFAEAYEDWPMRDRLDRLERLGYLDVLQWLQWRAARNRLAHEYPDAPEVRWAALADALQAARGLMACIEAWQIRLDRADSRS
jgi:hypothetical protein